jgi:DNA-binding CsgD family transcriptional regulator
MRVAQGRLEEATRLLADYDDHPTTAYAIALIRQAQGQAAAAAAILRRRLREVDADSLEAAALHELLVEVEIELGARERAAKRATELSGRGSTATAQAVSARGDRALGRILIAKSQTAQAVEHLERAAGTFVRIHMPIEAGRTKLLLAQALAASEGEAAVAEARAAFAVFDKVGAVREADAAAAVLRSLGTRAARTGPRAIGNLTKREREVLALLGEGLSNPEISQRLFITRKTVEHHVANVLAKVGLSGRGEAAAYAVRHLQQDSAPK